MSLILLCTPTLFPPHSHPTQAAASNWSAPALAPRLRALRACDSVALNALLTVADMQREHPIAVRALLPPFVALLVQGFAVPHAAHAASAHSSLSLGEAAADADEPAVMFPAYFEAGMVAVLGLLSSCVACKAYTSAAPAPSFSGAGGIRFDRAAQDEARAMAAQLCAPEPVSQWLQMLLTQLLLLTPAELAVWLDEPERFYAEELKQAAIVDCQSRAAALHLLTQLLSSPLTAACATATVVQVCVCVCGCVWGGVYVCMCW